tara:strand:+ start:26729 stop:28099 length:1371 start_codon:yes stop_codon:yes gene_type:complete
MKIIYISIEIKNRELFSKLFFIANNIKENFVFFIGDKLSIKRAIKYFGKGIYFYKSINRNDTGHISQVKNKKNLYVSLDEEGGFVQSNLNSLDSFLQYRSSNKNMSLIDRVYTWGDFDNKAWKKKYKKYKKKIVKTGSPRVDLWRRDIYTKIFKEDIKILKNKYGKFFFIPSTFCSSKADLTKQISNEKKIKSEETLFSLKARINERKYSYYLFEVFVSMIKKLSKDFPNYKILIKPHHTESLNNWEKRINTNKYKNIIIDNNYDLTAYMAASECVIYNASTAGIQAVVMGKKNIVFNGSRKDSSFINFPNKCSKQINKYYLLKKELNKKFSLKDNKKYLKQIKKRLLISQTTSSKKILKDIKKISYKFENDINIYSFKIKLLSIIYTLKDNLYNFKGNLGKLFKLKKYTSQTVYKRKMGEGITKKEIETFLKKLKTNTKFKISKFGSNGFIINKL